MVNFGARRGQRRATSTDSEVPGIVDDERAADKVSPGPEIGQIQMWEDR